MADVFTPRFVDLVRNSSTTVGTGNFVLGPAVSGFTSFAAAIQPGESFYYSAIGIERPAEREIGRGTLQSDGTISRRPIGGQLTDFTSGTKTIALVAAAEWYERVQAGSGGAPAGADALLRSEFPVKTPFMFGAQGDGVSDDSDALQAFFDDAFDPANCGYTYDFSGHWGIAKPLYFARPLDYGSSRNVTYHGRRFVCGTLCVLPVAQQPGGVAMDTVLTISGPYAHWDGHLFIHDGSEGTTPYASRRFKYGVRAMQCSQAMLPDVTVVSARKDALWMDSQYETWEVRTGTPYQAGSTSKNNISAKGPRLVAVNCGSTTQFGLASGRCYSFPISARVQGGTTSGVWSSDAAAFVSSWEQQTRLTADAAAVAELRVGDWGLMRTGSGQFSLHRIMAIPSQTEFQVHPWVPDSHDSPFYLVSGAALRVTGNDAACVRFDHVGAVWCGIGVINEGLYGPHIGTFLADYADIGIAHGVDGGTANYGFTIDHAHDEAVRHSIVQIGWLHSFKYSADSVFGGTVTGVHARSATDAPLQVSYELNPGTYDIHIMGQRFSLPDQVTRFNHAPLDNSPSGKRRTVLSWGNDTTVTLGFREPSARLGSTVAELQYVSHDGTSAVGALNFALDQSMTSAGWTLRGDTDRLAGGTRAAFRVIYSPADKVATVIDLTSSVPAEWTPNFASDGAVCIPASVAMTIAQGAAPIGTGNLAYEKSTAGAPGTFSATTLPASLEAGAWLRVSATGVTGFLAAHLRRIA